MAARESLTTLRPTPRECAVIKLLDDGCDAAEIGAILEISQSTVRTYMEDLRVKTGARNDRELVLIAYLLMRDHRLRIGDTRPTRAELLVQAFPWRFPDEDALKKDAA